MTDRPIYITEEMLERWSRILPTTKVKTKKLTLVEAVVLSGLAKSKSEARRLIEQGGISILRRVEDDQD